MTYSPEYIEHVVNNSPEWQADKRETKKQYRGRCMVCDYDYIPRGDYITVNHADYEKIVKSKTVSRFPLCSRHHPKGRYTWEMMRRDRFWYQFDKRLKRLIGLPFRLAWRSIYKGK